MSFSEKVKHAREVRGLTQQQLADATGISQRTIASYEAGVSLPRSTTLYKLAEALGVSADYLKRDEITDPSYGIEKGPYIEEARGRFGSKAAREVDALLEQNAALFAGGELSQEAKDDFFQAIMKAYLTCKDAARETYGRKNK